MSLFFTRFAELCRENNLSPNAVAKKLRISSGSITAWKKGTVPRFETIQKLADYFHVSTDYLMGNVNEPFFYLDNERILRDINSYVGETEKPAQEGELEPLDDDIVIIQRERRKMSDKEKKKLMKILQASFEEYNWEADDSGDIE